MTRLLFIHGIDGHGKASEWLAALNNAFAAVDRAPIAVSHVAPDYTQLLQGPPPESGPAIPLTPSTLSDLERHRLVDEFGRRAARIRSLAEQWPAKPNSRPSIPSTLQQAALKLFFDAASRYAKEENRRRQILSLLLSELDSTPKDLVIVAHSLGSIVALDLLYVLPPGTKVKSLLTAGSPLAIGSITKHLARLDKGFPYDRVESWVNVVEPRDFVTNGQGLAQRFPESLDVFVTIDSDGAHSAIGYFSQPVVGEILSDTLLGSKSRDVARREKGIENLPTKNELAFLLRLHYAKRVEHAIVSDDDRRRRFGSAREMLIDAIERSAASGPVPSPALQHLRQDLAHVLRGVVRIPRGPHTAASPRDVSTARPLRHRHHRNREADRLAERSR